MVLQKVSLKYFRKGVFSRECLLWLTVAFAIFSSSPHFHFVVHTHNGGNAGHFHRELSSHDFNLEREVIGASAAQVDPEKLSGLSGDTHGQSDESAWQANGSVEKNTWSTKNKPHWHTQEDVNVLSVTHDFFWIKIEVISEPSLPAPFPYMPAQAVVWASARAPPSHS